ncbi:MAG: hypothetical protein GY861_08450 [bacterium]|nr:hypothetical protein [bacterium]
MAGLLDIKKKLLAVDCLKSMKEQKTFRALSKELDLPAGVLNRYVNGYVLPKDDRADTIIDTYSKTYIGRMMDAARDKESKFIVTSDLLSKPFLLNVISYKVSKFFPERITKVFTAAVDGVPLAVSIANLINARSIYAKKTQEFSFSGHYISKSPDAKPISAPFYLPKNLLKRNDYVLIVDDVIRAGNTFHSLTSICEQAKANLVGIFSIFITRSALRELKKKSKVNYLFLAED